MASPKSCAILGHNPMRFAWGFDEEAAECHDMKMELAQQIMVLRQQGVTHFSVACDYGVGLYAAEIINALRNDDSEHVPSAGALRDQPARPSRYPPAFLAFLLLRRCRS